MSHQKHNCIPVHIYLLVNPFLKLGSALFKYFPPKIILDKLENLCYNKIVCKL